MHIDDIYRNRYSNISQIAEYEAEGIDHSMIVYEDNSDVISVGALSEMHLNGFIGMA